MSLYERDSLLYKIVLILTNLILFFVPTYSFRHLSFSLLSLYSVLQHLRRIAPTPV